VGVEELLRTLALIVGGFAVLEVWGLIVLAMTRGALTDGLLRAGPSNL
jgi:hypothetical protein